MKQFEGVLSPLALALILCVGCDGKQSECKALVGPIRTLGRRLALAQRATSSQGADASQVAAALRSFSRDAESTGATIAGTNFTVSELKRIADDAKVAAFALSALATQMEQAAKRMNQLEVSRQPLSIRNDRSAQELSDATKAFDAQVVAVSAAMTAAQDFCRR
jgi:chaperonin cofactor prefoldin